MTQNKKFFYYLEKVADDQLMLKENFQTVNASKILWGLGKFVNRGLAPKFNQDIASNVISRYEFTKVPSVNHRLHKRLVDQISELKKKITPANFAITMYSCASVGFYDRSFFD